MALVFLVLNGKSCASPAVREAVNRLRAEGYTLQVRVTWEAGDFQRYLLEAVQAGCETLIVGGGDGTLNEAVTSLLSLPPGQRLVLGILPLGTANDFATSAQIPLQPEAALRLALEANAVPMDVAVVNQNHHFINMATGGFGTRITTDTPEKLKAALGGVSYLLHGLMQLDTLKADQCEIRSEDFHWRGEALVIGIGNGRQAGGGQRLCPTALIDDGRLDLTIVTSQQLFPTLLHSMTRSEEMPHLITHRSQGFTLTAEHEMTFNLDGEPVKGRQFSFRLEAEAIRCRLPPQCPLLS